MRLKNPGGANVALIIETSVVYGREILNGISRYLAVHGHWSVFLDERELGAPPPDWLLDWSGDGVICRSTTPEIAEALTRKGIPTVDLNDRFGDLGLPRIVSDMAAIGRLAAEHLLQRGYTDIAYCGFDGEPWCDLRLAGVQSVCLPIAIFRTPWSGVRERAWQQERDAIAEWVGGLPRPLGIVACNDARAHHVLEACQAIGRSVPEEIAVIGVDNSETLCDLCNPPLSSVVPNAARVGYEAADLLCRLMAGETVAATTRLIEPTGVMARQSTDSVAITDPILARANQFIRQNAHHPITVDDVVHRSGVSRSTLERKYRTHLRTTPHEEIQIARLKRVKTLLTRTGWSLNRIAEETGFDHPEYMMVQFKRLTGFTPSQWRSLDKGSQ
jgi:LacI family transcriptional regulator